MGNRPGTSSFAAGLFAADVDELVADAVTIACETGPCVIQFPRSLSGPPPSGCRPSASLRVGPRPLRGVVALATTLLVLAVGALVFAASSASALTVDQVGTRVAAINPAEPTTVEAPGLLPPRSPPVSAAMFDDVALGCCVAPRGVGAGTDLVRYDPDLAMSQLTRNFDATASQLADFGASQGWKPLQSATGPLKFVDENGIVRLTIKRGSSRTPGSGFPHVEMRNAAGQRVDAFGNAVYRRDPGNHTPITWDLD